MLFRKKRVAGILITVVLGATIVLTSVALQGCGDDTAKQDFVDGVLSTMNENQAHSEIAQEGSEAFTAYAQSGFTDVESALKAADSFWDSNTKDEETLVDLDGLNKPDDDAESIVDTLEKGIKTMDEGNTINAEELDKAPDQSMEERAMIFNSSLMAMDEYIEGVSQIVESYQGLLDYAKTNSLEGQDEIQEWIDKFEEEKESLEQSKSSLESMTQG